MVVDLFWNFGVEVGGGLADCWAGDLDHDGDGAKSLMSSICLVPFLCLSVSLALSFCRSLW